MVILTIMFAGELVWRGRDFRMSNIFDSLPVPNWVFYASKLAGLMFMQVIFLIIIMVCGIIVQLFKGYTHFEILLYIQYLFGFRLLSLWLLAVLAIFIDGSLVSNKFLGYFIVGLFASGTILLPVSFYNAIFLYFHQTRSAQYSAMNRFGDATFPYLIFKKSTGVALRLCLQCCPVYYGQEGKETLR